MWNRKELKEKAKAAFRANYWKCVAVSVIFLIIAGGFAASMPGNKGAEDAAMSAQVSGVSTTEIVAIVLALMGVIAAIGTIAFVINLFLINPLQVGCSKFFKENAEFPAEFNELGKPFKTNYGTVILAMFLKNLFLALWALLFVIPAIVKAYSYRMVPYILADEPEISALDAITKSRNMMRGQKWRAFVLDLSFIGWAILSVLTGGILFVFYVGPYKLQTDAELYLALK